MHETEEDVLDVKHLFRLSAWLMLFREVVSRLSTVALQFYATLNALYAAFCGEHFSPIS